MKSKFVSGINFGLTCLDIALGCIILHFAFDFNITTDSLAMFRATMFWLFIIPMYWLSLGLFWLFYNIGHVWKKNGVIVGYEFDEDTDGPLEEQFKGHWVNYTSNVIDQECSDVLIENMRLDAINPPNKFGESNSMMAPNEQAGIDKECSNVSIEDLRPPSDESHSTFGPNEQIDIKQECSDVLRENLKLEAINPLNKKDSF